MQELTAVPPSPSAKTPTSVEPTPTGFGRTTSSGPLRAGTRAPPAVLFVRARHHAAGWGRGSVIAADTTTVSFVMSAGSFGDGSVQVGEPLSDVTLFTPRGRAYEGEAIVRRFFSHRGEGAVEIECRHCVDVALTHQALEEGRLRRLFAECASTFGGGNISPSIHAFVSALAFDLRAWAERMDLEHARARALGVEERAIQSERLVQIAAPLLTGRMRRAAAEGEDLLLRASPRDTDRAREYIRATLAPWMGRCPFVAGGNGSATPNRLGTARTREPIDAFGSALERYFFEEPQVVARRNLVSLLADRIEATARGRARGTRLLALDADVAEAVALVLARAPHLGAALDVTLLIDGSRIRDDVARSLAPAANRSQVRLHVQSARLNDLGRLVEKKRDAFDVVICTGRLDHVTERVATATLRTLSTTLAPGGILFAGTVASTSPSRFALDFFGGQNFRRRTADAWTQVGSDVAMGEAHSLGEGQSTARRLTVSLEQEPLGIQLVLRLERLSSRRESPRAPSQSATSGR